jgi:membrane protein
VPPARPRWLAIWPPALLAALGFHLATAVYAFYLARYGDVTALYGPLGAVLGFLLVVYVGVLIILLGAELVAAWPTTASPDVTQSPRRRRRGTRPDLSGPG